MKNKYQSFKNTALVKINPISLKFDSEDLNNSFAIHQAVKSIKLVRLSIAIAILIYIAFGFIQNTIMPGASEDIKMIRMAGIIFFSTIILLSFTEFFKHNYQLMMIVLMILGGVDVILIAINGAEFLYVGLILSVIYAHSLLRMRFIYASVTTWLLVISYYVSSAIWGSVTTAEIINSSFFLSSANTLGMFASYGIEYYMRSEYLKSHLLKEKSAELNNEYIRKSNELEAARQIQVAMLPKGKVIPDIDLSVVMKTASEIGGDYYDYHLSEDNTLTFAIGDATGHGARAGAMVTAMKILFSNYGADLEITDFLKKANKSIRALKLPLLHMTFAIGRIKKNHLEIAGTGLPPLLIHNKLTNSMTQIELKGLPLGSVDNYDFVKRKMALNQGDTLAVMTDGLIETFNSRKEMIGYSKVVKTFSDSVDKSTDKIVNNMLKQANEWSGGLPNEDDITLLVLRIKKTSDSKSGHINSSSNGSNNKIAKELTVQKINDEGK